MNDTGLSHRLLSIFAADAAGYSRLMADDDCSTVIALDAARKLFRVHIEAHDGRVIDMAGDSVLAAFETASGAVRAALAVQAQIEADASALPEARKMHFRIGIHLGDVIEKADGTVYGDGVNIAARLQELAEPGGVNVSDAVHGAMGTRVDAHFDDLGEHEVKNIAAPVHAFRVRTEGDNLRFGRFEIRFVERRLLIDGAAATLGAGDFNLLEALAKRPGQLVTRRELMDASTVDDSLAQHLSALRKVLGRDAIATIPGRGYRFTARIEDGVAHAPLSSARTRSGAATTTATLVKLKTNLPETLQPLIGRDDDLAALGALIDQYRLVTIVGAGGMGKTRLAQALLHARQHDARAYPHGVCWVELAPVNDATALPGAIAAALGVHTGRGDAMAGLIAATGPLALLIALDNAEHLLADVARVAEALHEAAPGLRLVVTSQAPLKLSPEHVYRLGALAVPEGTLPAEEALEFGAVALFVERAQAADARFALTDVNASAVIALCRALDGMALAIELAAARAPMLGVQRLTASLHERLKLLTTSGNRNAPARQQTLRAALEWSHGFLDEREQAVFRRLAVMAGSASLELVQQVVADEGGKGALDEWAVLDTLGCLVDRSLVVVGETDPPRYRLLDTPRAYAQERLAAAGELEALRRRHAETVAALFDAAWDERYSGRVGIDDWQRALEPDFDNAREAFSWARTQGDAKTALVIAATLLRALPQSLHAERVALAESCEALAGPSLPLPLRLRAWLMASRTWGQTRPQRSHAAALQGLTLARASGDRFGLYVALARCAIAPRLPDATAEAALDEMRGLEDPAWPPQRLLIGTEAEFFSARRLGQPDAALRLARKHLPLQRAAGESASASLANLIDAELSAGEVQAAVRTGTALVAQLQGTRGELALAYARLNLTAALLALDEAGQARAHAEAGWPRAPRFDLQPYWAVYLALLAALEGRPRDAARLAGYADAGYARREDQRESNEAQAFERATTLARGVLGQVEFDLLNTEGATLRDEDVERVALGTVDE